MPLVNFQVTFGMKKEVKALNINVSEVCRHALQQEIDLLKPENEGLRLLREHEGLVSQRQDIENKRKKIEKKAKQVLGMSLEEFQRRRGIEPTASHRDAVEWVCVIFQKVDDAVSKSDWELAELYESASRLRGLPLSERVAVFAEARGLQE